MQIKKAVYRELVKTDRHGNKIFRTNACKRCGGTGIMPYSLDHGRCWECMGSGITDERRVTEYTQDQMVIRNMKKTAKRLGTVEQQIRAKGFNADGVGYIPLGNTYAIRDIIRENGGSWDSIRGRWVCPQPLDGVECERVTVEDDTETEHVTHQNEAGEIVAEYWHVRWKA